MRATIPRATHLSVSSGQLQCTSSGRLVRPLRPCTPLSLADAAEEDKEFATTAVVKHKWFSSGVDLYFLISWVGYARPSYWQPECLHSNMHLLDYVRTLPPAEQTRVVSELEKRRVALPADSDDEASGTLLGASWMAGESGRGYAELSALVPVRILPLTPTQPRVHSGQRRRHPLQQPRLLLIPLQLRVGGCPVAVSATREPPPTRLPPLTTPTMRVALTRTSNPAVSPSRAVPLRVAPPACVAPPARAARGRRLCPLDVHPRLVLVERQPGQLRATRVPAVRRCVQAGHGAR